MNEAWGRDIVNVFDYIFVFWCVFDFVIEVYIGLNECLLDADVAEF